MKAHFMTLVIAAQMLCTAEAAFGMAAAEPPAPVPGVNGQPSLVYSARITTGVEDMSVDFVPEGTGSLDGSDRGISSDLSGIDTAYDLFASLQIIYRSR
jgi:hypothetical protein